MKRTLTDRLNEVLPRITSQEFLSSKGIGNEIACYIFDYPAEEELQVREHLKVLREQLDRKHSQLRVLHLNLFELMVGLLKKRGLLERAIEFDSKKGPEKALEVLRAPLSAEKLLSHLTEQHDLSSHDLVLVSGVGSAWPALRAHSFLNCVHAALGATPLVMFYPGSFDGTALRIFGGKHAERMPASTNSYYRAFTLIPE
jgi:hypothetical protein